MAYVPHYRLVTKFTLGPPATPLETAQCTLNFTKTVPSPNISTRQQMVNDCFTDWAAWVGSGDGKVTPNVRLQSCTLYSVGTDGKIDADPATSTGTPVSGTYGSDNHPWQCSVVVTLVAGLRGKGRLGRIYLPPQSYQLDNGGTLSPATATTLFAGAQTLLSALSNRAGLDAGWGLAIAGSTGAEGTLRPVVELRLGRVVDTQRRRRRSLPEGYLIAPFTA